MKGQEQETRNYSIFGFVVTFFATLIIARLVTDLVLQGSLIHKESWTSPEAWIVPIGFALIGCFAYWYRNKT
ncbi:hypothetical protein CPHO_01420 [Corynebacterium phocae]|uniref:Uncharacterized protein n=1 Tax=Corynebacterium phocae TaxID=161895 RepID=A0A1L7D125_9CORY|nr:hypothetical protein [Corynebacterium phocae]APT91794.1 hypothetical protein CPHO_01420 [Corynebacterium phocae]KAA8728465.1 hypothetical protein F4V58_00970 [Corynebacterium phocae]